jgi:hypothetical protein
MYLCITNHEEGYDDVVSAMPHHCRSELMNETPQGHDEAVAKIAADSECD